MKFLRTGRNISAVLLAGFVLFFAAAFTAGAEEPLKIGAIMPVTGSCAKAGRGSVNAIEMAVEEINKAGGISGRQIQLIHEADESMPAVSVAAAEKLTVKDKVHAVIGAFNSSCVLAHMQVTQREGVPQIDPIAFSFKITRSGNPFMFRNIPQANILGEKFGDFIAGQSGAKTWAIIHENTDYGLDYKKFIAPRLEKTAKILTTETYSPGDTDFYSQLTKVKNLKPDAILFISNMTEGTQLIKQLRELQIKSQLFATGSLATQQFRDLAGPGADGLYSLSFLEMSTPSPLAKKFIDSYKSKYGYEPDYFAAASYDSGYMIAEGMKTAYRTNGDKWPEDLKPFRKMIRDGIASINGYQGVQGKVMWNQYGEAPTDIYWIQWVGGKTRIIDIIKAEDVYKSMIQ